MQKIKSVHFGKYVPGDIGYRYHVGVVAMLGKNMTRGEKKGGGNYIKRKRKEKGKLKLKGWNKC
jgi:hypothetical protein